MQEELKMPICFGCDKFIREKCYKSGNYHYCGHLALNQFQIKNKILKKAIFKIIKKYKGVKFL